MRLVRVKKHSRVYRVRAIRLPRTKLINGQRVFVGYRKANRKGTIVRLRVYVDGATAKWHGKSWLRGKQDWVGHIGDDGRYWKFFRLTGSKSGRVFEL